MKLFTAVVLALFAGAQNKPAGSAKVPAALNFTMSSIDGKPVDLSKYQGQVVLMVNVASECGYTPQYAGLEELHKKYAAKGLRILGFPSNDFGQQEPGTEKEIKTFCETHFSVDFPMTAKEHVIGPEAHPLYKWIAGELGEDAAPKWNFHKYLFNKDGTIAGTFGSRIEPGAADLGAAIDEALKS